jgi:Pyridoxamine 5'-phosphate oxidase
MHQLLLTSAPVFSTIRRMIKLIDQMHELIDNALANGCPCILATAAPDGEPDIGYKGSMMVFDDESLAYWERTRRQHLKNVTANPKVVVLFRDAKTKVAWRFHGVATVHDNGSVRDQVMARTVPAELEKDPERKGSAVVIRIDRVTNMGGQVLQSR